MKRHIEAMDLETYTSKVPLVERNAEPMGVRLINPARVGRTDRSNLVELAKEIQTTDKFVQSMACAQLRLIAEQVGMLRRQAEKVLSDAVRCHQLHHAACNFHKVPGSVYHLYSRPSGQEYLSMLSPQEWGPKGPPAGHEFLGSFRLEADMSWRSATNPPPQPAAHAISDIFGPAEGMSDFQVPQPLRSIEGFNDAVFM